MQPLRVRAFFTPPLFAATLIGLSLPLLISGVATFQGAIALALIAVLAVGEGRKAVLVAAKDALATPMGFSVMAVLIAWIPSVALSYEPSFSVVTWGRMIVFAGGVVILWAFLNRDAARYRRALMIFLAAFTVMLVLAALGMRGFDVPIALLKGRAPGSFVVSNSLKGYASVAACVIPVTIWAGWRLGGLWRAVAVLDVLLNLDVIVTSESRSSFVGLLAMAALVVAYVVWRKRRGPLLFFVGLIVIAGLGLLALGLRWEYLVLPSYSPAARAANVMLHSYWAPPWLIDVHRQHIWQFVFTKFLAAPWFGQGLDVVNRLPGASDLIPGIGYAYVPSHPHSWLLEISAETGIVGLFAVLSVLVRHGVWIFKEAIVKRRTRALTIGAVSAVFWSTGLFNFSFWSSWWQLSYFLLLALVAAAPQSGDPDHGGG
ncbi:O-antigen ligase family protein [Varunaivibrio sulfuroxidans]|uniref:O-antigen ligase n=1 Tax=Varunaivibrio sulfuroxidans TaxID=1773489 RepID=A0A4R3JHY8_9PROT|nr:O-antigen ligase family protein [Varunaivibrio sulfuroxidans]TCS64983.1 O-antigen ligase [Varunaivibrio sulfuroxidans]WES29727.1 O-antigen ligase family protein [Varunaivibrio sulfuroxidans]